MDASPHRADTETDSYYHVLRRQFGSRQPQANGYRSQSFFLREQTVVFSALSAMEGPIVDIACGSGLMLLPHEGPNQFVFGIDFNVDACRTAAANGVPVVRGDAYALSLKSGSISQIVNCQFLNQQTEEGAKLFVEEAARVLVPGGTLIILWRHARSYIHRLAHCLLTVLDRMRGHPKFPQHEHPLAAIRTYAIAAGLIVETEAVTLPFLKPPTVRADSVAAHLIGASCLLVLRKPGKAN